MKAALKSMKMDFVLFAEQDIFLGIIFVNHVMLAAVPALTKITASHVRQDTIGK